MTKHPDFPDQKKLNQNIADQWRKELEPHTKDIECENNAYHLKLKAKFTTPSGEASIELFRQQQGTSGTVLPEIQPTFERTTLNRRISGGFSLKILRNNFLNRIKLGFPPKYPSLNVPGKYVLKTNNPDQVKQLLGTELLKNILFTQSLDKMIVDPEKQWMFVVFKDLYKQESRIRDLLDFMRDFGKH